jgi:predicted oxidoreductase
LNHPNAKTHLEIKFEHLVDEILMDKDRVVGIKGRDLTNHENLWEAYGEAYYYCIGRNRWEYPKS